jgi:REP element-mobilizing transposase RayT
LKGFDYSQVGWYFVTIDVQDKLELFWDENGINDRGRMVEKCWLELEDRFEVKLDKYVIMPDHVHGIVIIPGRRAAVGAGFMPAHKSINRNLNMIGQPQGLPVPMPAHKLIDGDSNMIIARNKLGEIIGAFKSIATYEYIYGVKNFNWPKFNGRLWQRNYYERIIRSENDLIRIRKYIEDNPKNQNFPKNLTSGTRSKPKWS